MFEECIYLNSKVNKSGIQSTLVRLQSINKVWLIDPAAVSPKLLPWQFNTVLRKSLLHHHRQMIPNLSWRLILHLENTDVSYCQIWSRVWLDALVFVSTRPRLDYIWSYRQKSTSVREQPPTVNDKDTSWKHKMIFFHQKKTKKNKKLCEIWYPPVEPCVYILFMSSHWQQMNQIPQQSLPLQAVYLLKPEKKKPNPE